MPCCHCGNLLRNKSHLLPLSQHALLAKKCCQVIVLRDAVMICATGTLLRAVLGMTGGHPLLQPVSGELLLSSRDFSIVLLASTPAGRRDSNLLPMPDLVQIHPPFFLVKPNLSAAPNLGLHVFMMHIWSSLSVSRNSGKS